jgi:transcriptional regulator with XRE-family HTH domain
VGTSQQQISRLESPSYEGHSLSMIRRVAEVLGAAVRVSIKPLKPARLGLVAEMKAPYRVKKNNRRRQKSRAVIRKFRITEDGPD